LADLRIQVGVGSVIDYAHQYQLHHDQAHLNQMQEGLRLASANLDAYRRVRDELQNRLLERFGRPSTFGG